jgi:ATP-dependent exoDNAse (exonuclease V) beta subunit
VAIAAATRLQRPHGKRFGTLVHAVLAAVPLDAGAEAVQAATVQAGRVLGAPADEQAAAVQAVAATLADPWLRRAAVAAAAGRCRRETAVALVLDDGTLVEGVVDLAFRDDGDDGWTVLDFKTDRELGGRLAEYRRQVGLYARAVSRATGMPACAVLLRV